MLKLVDHTVLDFLEKVDSKAPAPGGGSVSGLASSLGVSLLHMVGHITIGRKKYEALNDEQKQLFQEAWETVEFIKERLVPLIDEDTKAFNKIMAAYKMPKSTQQEQINRLDAIDLATIYAIEVPLQVALLSLDALRIIDPIKTFGNKNAISDVGVGVLQVTSGLIGSLMNVKINASGLQNKEQQASYIKQVDKIMAEANQLSNKLLQDIFKNL